MVKPFNNYWEIKKNMKIIKEFKNIFESKRKKEMREFLGRLELDRHTRPVAERMYLDFQKYVDEIKKKMIGFNKLSEKAKDIYIKKFLTRKVDEDKVRKKKIPIEQHVLSKIGDIFYNEYNKSIRGLKEKEIKEILKEVEERCKKLEKLQSKKFYPAHGGFTEIINPLKKELKEREK